MMNVAVDLREELGPSRDQGARKTCLAFATSAAHEVSRCSSAYLSVEYLYFMAAQRSHGDPRRGLGPAAVRDALENDGQPEELAWPYSPMVPIVSTWRPPPPANKQLHKAALSFSDRSVGNVLELINQRRPVVLGLSLTPGFYKPDKEARVLPEPGAVETTKHAVLAVGAGTDSEGQYILVRNTWGESWGRAGHAWLHETYVRERMLTTGVIERRSNGDLRDDDG
jgi:hypothetical protein